MTDGPRRVLVDPLIDNNPVTLQVLGICSALAVTTSLLPAPGSSPVHSSRMIGVIASAIAEDSDGTVQVLRRMIVFLNLSYSTRSRAMSPPRRAMEPAMSMSVLAAAVKVSMVSISSLQ